MENISLNEKASIDVDGIKVPAKAILCANKELLFQGLEALKVIVKNPILKIVVGSVITLIENVITKTCEK